MADIALISTSPDNRRTGQQANGLGFKRSRVQMVNNAFGTFKYVMVWGCMARDEDATIYLSNREHTIVI